MVRAVCGWGSREEVKVEVEEMKSKRTWSQNSLDNIDLVKLGISFGGSVPFSIPHSILYRNSAARGCGGREGEHLFRKNSVWVNVQNTLQCCFVL